MQNPKSEIRDAKSKIQNPKSSMQNPKSKIQNPKSKKNPKSSGGTISADHPGIYPGSEMSRAQILSFTAVGASRILLSLGGEFCSRSEFCSGLKKDSSRRDENANSKIQGLFRSCGARFSSESKIQNPETLLSERVEQNLGILVRRYQSHKRT